MTGLTVAAIAAAGMLVSGLIGLRSKRPARQTAVLSIAMIAWAIVITLVVIGKR